MRATAFVFIILFVTAIVPGSVLAAETTPIYPGMGDSQVDFYGRYPIANDNAIITQYIRECGIGRWYENQMDAEYRSVHIPPANSCRKQLVFSVRKAGERDDPTRIADIWIIGANETWSSSMGTAVPRKVPGFIVPGAVFAIVICAALFAVIRQTK
jgi:hypothetical protein